MEIPPGIVPKAVKLQSHSIPSTSRSVQGISFQVSQPLRLLNEKNIIEHAGKKQLTDAYHILNSGSIRVIQRQAFISRDQEYLRLNVLASMYAY